VLFEKGEKWETSIIAKPTRDDLNKQMLDLFPEAHIYRWPLFNNAPTPEEDKRVASFFRKNSENKPYQNENFSNSLGTNLLTTKRPITLIKYQYFENSIFEEIANLEGDHELIKFDFCDFFLRLDIKLRIFRERGFPSRLPTGALFMKFET
jgi:hypothetical protein